MKMTIEELAAKLKEHAKWLETRLTSDVKGSRADLSYADLSYADLTRADLSYADLSYADLTRANLTSADLSYADLSYADLTRADLSYADLSYVDLTGAGLTRANFNSCRASPLVYDALAASFAARMAMAKTAFEWENAKNRKDEEEK